jgi:hypothetical protein
VGVRGWVLVIRLDVEIWVIGKGGTKKGGWERGGWGKRNRGFWVSWPLCVFGRISVVVVEGAVSGIAGSWGCI